MTDSYKYGDPANYSDESPWADEPSHVDAYYIRQTVIEHLIPLFNGDDTEGLIKAADRIVKYIING